MPVVFRHRGFLRELIEIIEDRRDEIAQAWEEFFG
jgi:hypothetical protein